MSRFIFAILAGVSFTLRLAASPPGADTPVKSTTTLHQDGSKTETVKDSFKHEMTETIYDARGVVIAKKKFLLGASGDPTQGTIYDGAGNVIATVQFFFDDLGRVIEERCTNTNHEVFQRVIRQYDVNGKPLQPQVINLPVKAPTMRPARVDYTVMPAGKGGKGAPQPASGSVVSPITGQPVTVGPEPVSGTVPQQPQPKAEKKGSKLNPLNWFKKKDSSQ